MALADSAISILDEQARRRAEVRNVIKLAVPVVITTSSRAVMDIADYIMITRLNLPEAQAAILPAQVVMWSYIVLGFGIASMVNSWPYHAVNRWVVSATGTLSAIHTGIARQYQIDPATAKGSQQSDHNEMKRVAERRSGRSERVKKVVRNSANQPAAIIATGVRKASCGR